MNLYEKLIEVRKEVPYLQKENQGEQYKYVSSSQVLGNVKAKLDELKILLIPSVSSHLVTTSSIEFLSEKGNVTKRTNTYFTELDMTMTWINAEKPDEKIECLWYGQGVDIAGEKGVGKALTYAEKYFILKFFNIPTDKDDPDSFQSRMEDDRLEAPKSGLKSNNQSTIDKRTTDNKNTLKNDSAKPATKEQVKELDTLGKEKYGDMKLYWARLAEMAAEGRISTQYTYKDKERTIIQWTTADYESIKTDLRLPF